MSDQKRFFIHTLGCKVNQYDSQALNEAWTGRGLAAAHSQDEARIVAVNSCAVTAKAVIEAKRLLRRIRREAPNARLILTGCAARVAADKFKDVEGLEILLAEEALSCAALRETLPGQTPAEGFAPGDRDRVGALVPPKAYPACGVSDYGRARAVLKIQDGCSQRCAYCIVPDARGPSRSRPLPAILDEAHLLLEAGFRELILSGINLSQYGRDLGQTRDNPDAPGLWEVLRSLDALVAARPETARLRLSSLDPARLDERALDALASCKTLCPHLHISLQSAAPDVLQRMGRGRTKPENILRFVQDVSKFWPTFGLGMDVLTGFPGETPGDFLKTLEFCRQAPLSYAHVFPYSRRPGTPAANFPGQIPREVKKERAALLRELAASKKADFARTLAGMDRVHAVIESQDHLGGSCEYYVECRFLDQAPLPRPETRSLVPAAPQGAENGVLLVSLPDRKPGAQP